MKKNSLERHLYPDSDDKSQLQTTKKEDFPALFLLNFVFQITRQESQRELRACSKACHHRGCSLRDAS